MSTRRLAVVARGPELADPGLVGHKFARLARLRRAGLLIPDLFCLPATWYDAAAGRALAELPPPPPRPPSGAHEDAADEAVAAWCARAAQALRTLRIPAEWAEAVLAAFDDRFGPGTLVAVRACAVPAAGDGGEDGADDPFAGLSDSFLSVPRGCVLDRIRQCWASAYTARGVRYRAWRGLDPTRTRVAVGVQRMVPGTRSFVAFSRDPRDGAHRVVIAAAHGIGEGVVQEKADVDHFFVVGGQVTAELVHKERMVVAATPGAEPAVVAVPAELAAEPVLADAQAVAVAELAAEVERLFGGPQDIEGTITADGVVHLLQARPIAAVTTAARTGARRHWCNHNITESYPGVSGVLTYSQAGEFYRRAFGDLYRRMGVPRRRFDANRHHLEQLVAFLDGRIYYRLDAWHALHGQLPVFELVRAQWEEAMGVTGPARARQRWSRRRAWAALPGTLARALRHPGQVRAFLRWWDGVLAEAGDLADRSPEELVAFHRRLWCAVSVRWGVTLTNSIYALLAVTALTSLLDRWGYDRRLLGGLLVGGRENRSLQAVRAAIRLAELAAQVPELAAELLGDGDQLDDKQIWHELCAGRYGGALAEAAADYLRRFGDRALHDLKLEEPTPRQRPWLVLGLLRPYLRQGLTVAANRADELRAVRAARQDLARACPGRLRRLVLRTLAAVVRATVRVREDTRFCRTQLFGLSRQVMWRLGEELAGTGRIAAAADVRELTVGEVLGAFDGTLAGSDLRALVAVRRTEQERYRRLPARPALLATEPDAPLALALAAAVPVEERSAAGETTVGATVLHGLASSGGRVRARARLVLTPDITAESCRDAILVARETDPGWLFLMMAARGIVVERGTLLSHTAITGRLLGIPTIVAVPGATIRIRDGALLEMDGTTGTVRVLEGPPR